MQINRSLAGNGSSSSDDTGDEDDEDGESGGEAFGPTPCAAASAASVRGYDSSLPIGVDRDMGLTVPTEPGTSSGTLPVRFIICT